MYLTPGRQRHPDLVKSTLLCDRGPPDGDPLVSRCLSRSFVAHTRRQVLSSAQSGSSSLGVSEGYERVHGCYGRRRLRRCDTDLRPLEERVRPHMRSEGAISRANHEVLCPTIGRVHGASFSAMKRFDRDLDISAFTATAQLHQPCHPQI